MIKLVRVSGPVPEVIYINPIKIDCILPREENISNVFQGEDCFIVEGSTDQIARLINQWFKDHLQTQTHMMRGMM